ncbi:MAG: DNA polymerase IV [Firmicutes bacterium HGW-Firmicutes-21]|nr:MAG: DNA polymerase IV [Firmicutes bacterium HGW-Firmicutes-21]
MFWYTGAKEHLFEDGYCQMNTAAYSCSAPERVVLHCDMNNYFASVESVYNPGLKGVPLAVCGDPASRHGIVLAKNNIAKRYGVVTGESMFTAKAKCPSLVTVTADYSRYLKYARFARKIYSRYSDIVTPYGLDEAWLELDSAASDINCGITVADEIRTCIKKELGLTASIGVSYNYIFSKLGSDIKKPDAVTVISKDNYKHMVWNRPAFELLFVGSVTRKKLYKMGILSIGDLARSDPMKLSRELGKRGYMLWEYANGDDRNFCPTITNDDEIKSIGNSITTPVDITNSDDIAALLYIICSGISKRLAKHSFKSRCVGINVKNCEFYSYSRRTSFTAPINTPDELFEVAYKLFQASYDWTKPVRMIGVFAERLCDYGNEQLCFYPNTPVINPRIKDLVRSLPERLGKIKLEDSATHKEAIPDIQYII